MREQREAAAETREVRRERTLRRALVDMGIPAADVHEPDAVSIAHEPRDALRFELEALDAQGIAARGAHFL